MTNRGKRTEAQEKTVRERSKLIEKAKGGNKEAARELLERFSITKVYSQDEIDAMS